MRHTHSRLILWFYTMDKPYETSRGLLWAGIWKIYGGSIFSHANLTHITTQCMCRGEQRSPVEEIKTRLQLFPITAKTIPPNL